MGPPGHLHTPTATYIRTKRGGPLISSTGLATKNGRRSFPGATQRSSKSTKEAAKSGPRGHRNRKVGIPEKQRPSPAKCLVLVVASGQNSFHFGPEVARKAGNVACGPPRATYIRPPATYIRTNRGGPLILSTALATKRSRSSSPRAAQRTPKSTYATAKKGRRGHTNRKVAKP